MYRGSLDDLCRPIPMRIVRMSSYETRTTDEFDNLDDQLASCYDVTLRRRIDPVKRRCELINVRGQSWKGQLIVGRDVAQLRHGFLTRASILSSSWCHRYSENGDHELRRFSCQ